MPIADRRPDGYFPNPWPPTAAESERAEQRVAEWNREIRETLARLA